MISKNKIEMQHGCLTLLSPFILVLVGILVFVGVDQKLDVVLERNQYKKGYIIVDSIQDYSGSGVRVMDYYGYGKIEHKETRGMIYIGTGKDTEFNRKKYPVFYRQDGKLTIRRKEKETKFNVTPYVIEFIGFAVVPILLLILLSIYYYKLRERLKN
ncbi:hypothetical protein HX109_05975 [Galbibacter sp. BG1]|uniref:hypothetical protein n=1 Tax=Galbibacter sp. BG1 TaxID=1170699 RepID=UPI0015BC1AB6|nr:hypothetical protein [Galbibacter sp. BG1]QLE01132.1 hypothetical protein HX109_05975 [Galbibacter sp. BG1]